MDPKVGVIGYFGHGNAGDEAMRELVMARFPNSISNNLKNIDKCDAYIIAGGDLVQKFSGLHYPQLWDTIKSEPCYAISLGVGDGWEKYQDQVIGYLSKFRKIFTRDQKSFDVLSTHVHVDGVMPDLVLLADAPNSKTKYPILLNYTDREWLTPGNQFEDIISSADVMPVAISEETYDRKYSDNVMNWHQFIAAAKSSKGVVGVRLHAVVMGAIAGVPVAGISYEDKVRKFCQRYDIPIFEYGKKNGKEVVAGIRKAKIDLPVERKKIEDVINIIKSDLEGFFAK